jgi:hypothetical protein
MGAGRPRQGGGFEHGYDLCKRGEAQCTAGGCREASQPACACSACHTPLKPHDTVTPHASSG